MNFKLWLESTTRQPWVYHVTYYTSLDLISDEGLDYKQYGGANFPKPWLQTHSTQGNFFVSNISDVGHWIHTLEYQAMDKSDNIKEDGLIPIILRFRLNPKKHIPDQHRETPSDNLTDRIIPPQGIQVWDGKQWLGLAYWNNIDPETFIDEDIHGVTVREDYPMPV